MSYRINHVMRALITPGRERFRRIEVRVKDRPGLTVLVRGGLFEGACAAGSAGADRPGGPDTPEEAAPALTLSMRFPVNDRAAGKSVS